MLFRRDSRAVMPELSTYDCVGSDDMYQRVSVHQQRFLGPHRFIFLPRATLWEQRSLRGGRGSLKVYANFEPQEVVQECLKALRRVDIERFEAHFVPNTINFGTSEHQVLLLGGRPYVEEGPLAQFVDVLDVGARRVLPAHLLRRSQGISALQKGPSIYIQRTAVTARSGEEAVLEWVLTKHGKRWCVNTVRRDAAADDPLPESPHPRCSPESVVLAQLHALQRGDLQQCLRFFLWPGARAKARIPVLERSFQEGQKRMLIGHKQAELYNASIALPQLHTQDVSVTLDREAQQQWGRECAEFVWHMCMRDNGCWMCRDIECTA